VQVANEWQVLVETFQVRFLIYCLEHASRLADEQREFLLGLLRGRCNTCGVWCCVAVGLRGIYSVGAGGAAAVGDNDGRLVCASPRC